MYNNETHQQRLRNSCTGTSRFAATFTGSTSNIFQCLGVPVTVINQLLIGLRTPALTCWSAISVHGMVLAGRHQLDIDPALSILSSLRRYLHTHMCTLISLFLRWSDVLQSLRGTIINRIYGINKNLYISLFFVNSIWSYLIWSPIIVLVTCTLLFFTVTGVILQHHGHTRHTVCTTPRRGSLRFGTAR